MLVLVCKLLLLICLLMFEIIRKCCLYSHISYGSSSFTVGGVNLATVVA